MTTPIILLVGQAGSGKDTTAELIAKHYNSISIAQSDPMKAFCFDYFNFSVEQLWGPSSARNAKDVRFSLHSVRKNLLDRIRRGGARGWLEQLLPTTNKQGLENAYAGLVDWAQTLLLDAGEAGGLTPRKTLQTLGTEFGRKFGDMDMWVNYATRNALRLLGGGYSYERTRGLYFNREAKGFDFVVITDGRFRNELTKVKSINGKVFQILAPDTNGSEAESAGVKGHQSEAEQRSIPSNWFDVRMTNDKRFGMEALEVMVKEVMGFVFDQVGTSFEPLELSREKAQAFKDSGILAGGVLE